MRAPLLAALDVEYARATKAKNTGRMAEISAIVDALKGLWPDLAPVAAPEPVAVPAPVPEVLPMQAEQPAPEPVALPPPDLPPEPGHAHDWRAATKNVMDDPIWDNYERRLAGREAIRDAVARANNITAGEQFRYELALMVVNENVEAMNDMKAVAAASGLPVKEYAKRTIAIHNARRRRAAQIYAIEAQALRDIDAAAGDAIEAITEKAVTAINGEG